MNKITVEVTEDELKLLMNPPKERTLEDFSIQEIVAYLVKYHFISETRDKDLVSNHTRTTGRLAVSVPHIKSIELIIESESYDDIFKINN